MLVTIEEDEDMNIHEIVIRCKENNELIEKIYKYIQDMNETLSAIYEGEQILISPDEIFYIESVDKKTFIYLEKEMMECSLKLYEIEEKYKEVGFFRATKSTIVNIRHIRKVRPMLNRNLLVTLSNDERLIISRRNVKEFKRKIGWELLV